MTIEAARATGLSKRTSLDKVIVDTTPKAIAHPTDSRLLERSRQHMVNFAQDHGINLRQNYNREAPRLAMRVGRYAHAKQYKRMHAAHAGGPCSERCAAPVDEAACASAGQGSGPAAARGPDPDAKDQRQEQAVCPARAGGRVHLKRQGTLPLRVRREGHAATTLKEGLVVGMRSMPGNPYDGHTLEETIEQVSILANQRPRTVMVDKGYKGVEVDGVQILRSGQRRGVTRTMEAMIKRRSAIEPTIGHMKSDSRLDRNPLKGALGDALHAVLCGAGHNIRLLLSLLRLFVAHLQAIALAWLGRSASNLRIADQWLASCSGWTNEVELIFRC